MGTHVLSGRVFEIFPSYPLSLHGYCLRSLECAEGACIVRRPSYMHHPPIAILLRESTPSTLLAFFVLHKPLRPGPHLPSIPASCVRSYDFAPLHIRVVLVGSTVDGEKKEEMEIWREHGRKGVREGGDRKRDKESTKSRGRRGLLQSALRS